MVESKQAALWGGACSGLHRSRSRSPLQNRLPPERWPLAEGIRRDYKQHKFLPVGLTVDFRLQQ